MAKKKPLKKKNKSLLDMLPKNEEEYLEMLIKVSESYVGPNDTGLDRLFKDQADRQRKRLEALRKGK